MATYTISGTSRRHGTLKVRFANDMARIKTLVATDHTEIDLIELPEAMDKEAAIAHLLAVNFADGNAEKQSVLEAEAKKRGIAYTPVVIVPALEDEPEEDEPEDEPAEDTADLDEGDAEDTPAEDADLIAEIEAEIEAALDAILEAKPAPVRDAAGRFQAWAAAAAGDDEEDEAEAA
jgi:hypothetical protein